MMKNRSFYFKDNNMSAISQILNTKLKEIYEPLKSTVENRINITLEMIYEDIVHNVKEPYVLSLSSRGELYPSAKIIDMLKNEIIIFPWIVSYKNFNLSIKCSNKEKKEYFQNIKMNILKEYFKTFLHDYALIKIDEATTFGSHLFLLESLYQLAQIDKDLLPRKMYFYNIHAPRYHDSEETDHELIKGDKSNNIKKANKLMKKINEMYKEEKIIHKIYPLGDVIPWQDNEQYYSKLSLFYLPYPLYFFTRILPPWYKKEIKKTKELIMKYYYILPVNIISAYLEKCKHPSAFIKKASIYKKNGLILILEENKTDSLDKKEKMNVIFQGCAEELVKRIKDSLEKEFGLKLESYEDEKKQRYIIYKSKKSPKKPLVEVSYKYKENEILSPFHLVALL